MSPRRTIVAKYESERGEVYEVRRDAIVAVYDAEGWIDRYTVVLNPELWEAAPGRSPMLTASEHPDFPEGVSQFGEGVRGRHLGKRIRFRDLPADVQAHIRKRLREGPDA